MVHGTCCHCYLGHLIHWSLFFFTCIFAESLVLRMLSIPSMQHIFSKFQEWSQRRQLHISQKETGRRSLTCQCWWMSKRRVVMIQQKGEFLFGNYLSFMAIKITDTGCKHQTYGSINDNWPEVACSHSVHKGLHILLKILQLWKLSSHRNPYDGFAIKLQFEMCLLHWVIWLVVQNSNHFGLLTWKTNLMATKWWGFWPSLHYFLSGSLMIVQIIPSSHENID